MASFWKSRIQVGFQLAYCIQRVKEKNHMIISMWYNSLPKYDFKKTPSKLGIQGNLLNMLKDIQKSAKKIILYGETLEIFPFKLWIS